MVTMTRMVNQRKQRGEEPFACLTGKHHRPVPLRSTLARLGIGFLGKVGGMDLHLAAWGGGGGGAWREHAVTT